MVFSASAVQLTFDSSGCKAIPVAGYMSETALFDTKRSRPTSKEILRAKERALESVINPRCKGLDQNSCLAIKRQTRVVDYAFLE